MSAKQTIPAEEIQAIHHWNADFSFLPFIVSLLEGSSWKLGAHPLPHTPDAVTENTVDGVQNIIHRAVLYFLTREIGWTKQLYLSGHAEKPYQGRLWDCWERTDTNLSFSAHSMTSLLAGYNLTRHLPTSEECRLNRWSSRVKATFAKNPLQELEKHKSIQLQKDEVLATCKSSITQLRQMKLQKNGDLFLHHLMVRCLLVKTEVFTPELRKVFFQNPIQQLTHFHLCDKTSLQRENAFEPLLDQETFPFFPWLGLYVAKQWLSHETCRWSSKYLSPELRVKQTEVLDVFTAFNKRQSIVLSQWIEQIRQHERYDAFVGVMFYYKKLLEDYGSYEKIQERFHSITSHCLHMERRDIGEQWALVWTPAFAIQRIFALCQRIHPIDREAHHHLLMESYQELDFDEVLTKITRILDLLQPKIGN